MFFPWDFFSMYLVFFCAWRYEIKSPAGLYEMLQLLLSALTTTAPDIGCFQQVCQIFCEHIPAGKTLQWRHNGHDSISNHQPHDCLLNHLFRRRSKKTSKLRATGLCAGNSSGTGEFPAQMASNAEKVSIWWRHHGSSIWHTEWFMYLS